MIYLYAFQLLSAVGPIIWLPMILKYFDPQHYGNFLSHYIVFQLALSIIIYPLSTYNMRLISGSSKEKLGEGSLRLARMLQIIFSIVALIFFVLLVWIINQRLEAMDFVLGLALISFVCSSEWWFFSENNYKPIFIRLLVIRILQTIAVYNFVNSDDDLFLYVCAICLGFVMQNVVSFYLAPYRFFSFVRVQNMKLTESILGVKYFVASASIGSVFQYVDQILIGYMLGPASLAMVNLLKQLYSGAMMLPIIYNKWVLATEIKKCGAGTRSLSVTLNIKYICLTLIAVLIVWAGIPLITLISINQYVFSAESIVFCSFSVLATSFLVAVDYQILIPNQNERITTAANLVSMIVFAFAFVSALQIFSYATPFFALALSELSGLLLMVIFIKKWNTTTTYQ